MGNDIIFERLNGVAIITLNRPDKMNVFSIDMLQQWLEALEEVRVDDSIRVVIVTGKGDYFCAGGDIAVFASGHLLEGDEQLFPLSSKHLRIKNVLWKLIQRVVIAMNELDKPVIAAINGIATGAGLDMALACDLRVAAETALMGDTYVKIGLVPGDGGAFLLPRLVGLAKALELLWTGDLIDACESAKIGLVNKVVPHEKLMEETMQMADKIATGPPIAISLIKRAVYQGLRMDLKTSLDLISSHLAIVAETEDFQEGVAAFLEKRKPIFKGR